MLLEPLLALTASLIIIFILTLVNKAIRLRLALRKFKKQLPNVPFDDEDVDWFSNHFFKILFHNNCKRIHERHRKYGHTFAGMYFENPAIATCDLNFIKQYIIDEAHTNINRLEMKLPLKEYQKDCILFAKDEQWRRIRKSFAPALKPRNFKTPNVVAEIETTVSKLITAIERHLDKHEQEEKLKSKISDEVSKSTKGELEFNIDNLMHRFSLDIVMSCFYKQCNRINFNLDQNCKWVDLVDFGLSQIQNNPMVHLSLIMPTIRHIFDFVIYRLLPKRVHRRILFHFLKIITQNGLKANKHLQELRAQNKNIDEKNFILKDGTKFKRNMIDHIVDQYHFGNITKDEFYNSSSFLFAAGDKTVCDSLVFTLYQLAINENIQDKLRNKIGEFGLDSEYLSWVINESLRLNSPVSAGPSRMLSKSAKLADGSIIEAGTFVVTSLYTIHRLPEYWGEDAEEFKPERWLDAHKFHPAQYMPFGAGFRQCLGKEFAIFEMKKVLCSLLERYKFGCHENRRGLHDFDAPMLIFMLHHSPYYLTISRL